MPRTPDAQCRKLEIKKYPNRRYYDATHSRHLTLEEIRALIQQGYDLTVTDAKTGADITAPVLTQIILELETSKLDSFPVPLLVRLIRMNDLLVKDFIEKYFNQALKSFFEYQQQFEEQIRRTHGLPSAFPSVSAWTKAMFQPFSAVFQGQAAEPPEAPADPATGTEELRDMIHDLRRQVAALKQSGGNRKSRRRVAPRRAKNQKR